MTLKSLQARQDQARQEFDKYTEQKKDIEDEMLRLQGEFRVLEELINKAKPKEK